MLYTRENIQLLTRRVVLICLDSVLITLACLLALLLRFDLKLSMIEPEYFKNMIEILPVVVVLTLVIFWIFRIYNSLWEYAGIIELTYIAEAGAVSMFFQMLLMIMTERGMPRSYYLLYYALLVIFVGCTRIMYRLIRKKKGGLRQLFAKNKYKNIMIVGAGEAGTALIREIQTSEHLKYNVKCALDIDKRKHGKFVRGVPVLGDRNDIIYCAEKFKIDIIFIALPKLSAKELQPILEICHQTDCEIKKVPAIYQLMNGEVSVSKMRKVEIEDLLGRDAIQTNMDEIFDSIAGKTILVTGGGGSIGSELCRQIAAHHPANLIIFDIYENNAYDIQQELRKKYPLQNMKVLIGSVRDSRRIQEVFETYKPDIVYHAAAHKHVPLMEDSPNESIKNNVIGTYKTAYAAMQNGCEKFVLISTDKAVNPTNIMGASKRLCEMVIQSYDHMVKIGKADRIQELYAHAREGKENLKKNPNLDTIKTEFVAVRFGNVLGSNGSVIPLFKECDADIDEGVTCRAGSSAFWMTWDGRMLPCGMMPEPATFPLEVGFTEAWRQIREMTRAIRTPSECVKCAKKDVCNVCAAVCIAETGKFDGVPEYVCQKTDHMIRLMSEVCQTKGER